MPAKLSCAEAIMGVWALTDKVRPERRHDMLCFAVHHYDPFTGAHSPMTKSEAHLLACLDCDDYDECGANLRQCRCSPRLEHESSSGEG